MFNVIVDTQEKQPWTFESVAIGETIHRKLDTGDYTVQGLEDKLCIERKKSVSEFATNCTEDRFQRELYRMKKFPYAYLIFEFDLNDINAYPMGSGVPKKAWRKLRVRGPYMCKRISEILVFDNIPVILAGSTFNAIAIAISIMKRVNEEYTK